jgi:hypothetical protein
VDGAEYALDRISLLRESLLYMLSGLETKVVDQLLCHINEVIDTNPFIWLVR